MKDNVDTPVVGQALSELLADYAAGFKAERIPAEVRERARLLMLDSIGIALASHGYDFARRAIAAVGELDGGGHSIVIGTSVRMDPRNAALVNGVLVHGLDYDDTHARGGIHATASVLPTVLALAAMTDYQCDPHSGFPKHYSGEVIVELNDGRILREREAVNRGAEDRPLTTEDIRGKYRDNALRQVSAARAESIEQSVLQLEQGSARALADQLGQA